MTFKQNLEKFRNTFKDISVWGLQVADELDNYLENQSIHISNDDFENICEFVYDWILSTSATSYEVIDILFDGFKSGEISISELTGNYHDYCKVRDFVNNSF